MGIDGYIERKSIDVYKVTIKQKVETICPEENVKRKA